MKSSTLPPLRVDSATRAAAESVLLEGETLSGFVLDSVRRNIERREAQQAFIARGLIARDEARRTGKYVSAAQMLARLDDTLSGARKRAAKPDR